MPVWLVFGVQSSATDTLSRAGCACDGTVAAAHAAAHSTTARIDTFTSYSLRWHYPDQVNTGPEPNARSQPCGHPGRRQASAIVNAMETWDAIRARRNVRVFSERAIA